jgi:hypothetical protein
MNKQHPPLSATPLQSPPIPIKYLYSNKKKRQIWQFKCSCGQLFTCRLSDVKSGNTQSCGHLKRQAGEQMVRAAREHSFQNKRSATSDSPALSTNHNTGIRNIYQDAKGYRVIIAREKLRFDQRFSSLSRAIAAKEIVIQASLKGNPRWNQAIEEK